MTMNRKHLAFLPDDIPLRLGPPIRNKPKVEITPAPPFMVEALERIEDTCLSVSGNAFDKLAEQFKSTTYASASPSYHSGGVLGKTAIQEERMRREIAKHLRNPQPTHGSVSVVIDESAPVNSPYDEFCKQQIKAIAKALGIPEGRIFAKR